RIQTWAGWHDAWVATGDTHLAIAEEAESRGHLRTAGEAYLRAALCYHYAKNLWLEDLAKVRATTDRSVATLRRGQRILDPTFERIEIPFDKDRIVANLRRPAGASRPPVVILAPGLDAVKEEFPRFEDFFLARGMATASLDGPGQGEAGYVNRIRPDHEAASGALIDVLSRRSDIDASRVGIAGIGLGGYYATRSAAFEPRIRAAAAVGGPYTLTPRGHALRKFMHSAGLADEDEARAYAARFTLEGVASRVLQPYLVLHGKLDAGMPWEEAARKAREARQGELVVYPEGKTACYTVDHIAKPYLADWMGDKLRA